MILVLALIIIIGLLAIWPGDEPANLPITSDRVIAGRLVAGASGEVDGKRYLAVLTSHDENNQPALEIFSVSDSGDLTAAGSLVAPITQLGSELPAAPVIDFVAETIYVPLAQSRDSVFWVVDVSDPDSPRQLSATPLETAPGSVAVDGDLAAVRHGILTRFFDISNPAAPEQVGVYRHSFTSPANIELANQTLYVADRYGISVVDITSPDDPREIGRYEDDTWVSRLQSFPGYVSPRIALEGTHLFVAADEYGVNVLDISDATDPDATTRHLERNPGSSQVAVDAAATSMHLAILQRQGLDYVVRVFDISNPGDPDIVAETEPIPATTVTLSSLAIDDAFVYFLDGSTIHVISLNS